MLTSRCLQLWMWLLLFSVAITGAGCKEKDVPFVIDEDEVERLILESANGRELFRTDGIITPDPYVAISGNDTITFIDSVISLKRSVDVELTDSTLDYGNLGAAREGLAIVRDTFVIKTIRTIGGNDTTFQRTAGYTRRGYVLKLGDDGDPYVGWVLWGFNGGMPNVTGHIQILGPHNEVFVDEGEIYTRTLKAIPALPYVHLTEIPIVPRNEFARVASADYDVVTLEQSGEKFENFGNDTDTVRVLTTSSRFYNLLVNHTSTWSTNMRQSHFVPFRLQ